jgi:hypothetical protein
LFGESGRSQQGLHIRHYQPDYLRAGGEETDLRESTQARRHPEALDEAIDPLQIVIKMRGKTITSRSSPNRERSMVTENQVREVAVVLCGPGPRMLLVLLTDRE